MAPTLQVIIGAKIDELTAALDTVETRMSKTASTLQSAGLSLTAGLTAPLVAAGTTAITTSTSFEAAMTKINTLVGVSKEQVKEWGDQLLQLGPQVGQSPKDLADALYFVTSAGLRGGDAIDVLTQSAKAAEMGLGSTANVADVVTSAINSYGAANITATQATDQLVAIVTQGKMKSEELAGEFGRILPIANAVGVSFAQAGGFIATFTRLGVSSAEAVTALRAILLAVIRPAKQSQDALAEVGMSAATLKAEIQDKGLAPALVDLMQKFQAIGKEDDLAKVIPNVRGLAGALAVAGSQGEVFQQVTKNIENAVGNLNSGFETFQGTTKFTWDQFTSEVESTSVAFGNDLAPSFKTTLENATPLLDAMKELAHWFSELPGPAQTTAIGMLALAAAVGPVTYLIGSLVKVWASLAAVASTTLGWLSWLVPLLPIVGSGIAVIGTAWASWDLGRWIASATGADTVFEKLGLRLRGFTSDEADAITKTHELNDLMAKTPAPNLAWLQAPGLSMPSQPGDKNAPGYVAGGVAPWLQAPTLTDEQQKAAKEYAKLVERMNERLNGSEITKTVNAWMTAMENIGGVYNLTTKEQDSLNSTLKDAIDLYDAIGKKAPQAWLDTYDATKKALDVNEKFVALARNSATNLGGLPTGVGGTGVQDVIAYGDIMDSIMASRQETLGAQNAIGAGMGRDSSKFMPKGQLDVGMFAGFDKLLAKDLPSVALRALEGGGNVGASLGSTVGTSIFSNIGKNVAGRLNNIFGPTIGGALDSMLPGVGSLLGGLASKGISALMGLFKGRSTSDQVAQDIAPQFGGLSSNTQQKIVGDVGQYGGSNYASTLGNLGSIMQEHPVDTTNLSMYESKVHDIFSMIQQGHMTVVQAGAALDQSFAQVAAVGVDAYGRIDDKVKELIRLNQQFGTDSKAIATFLQGQGTNAMAGFVDVAKGLTTAVKMDKQSLADLGTQAVATFAAAVASGTSEQNALKQLSQALTQIQDSYKALGLDVNDVALKALLMRNQIVNANPDLIAAIGGLSSEMVALDNMGLMNVKTLEALERTGVAAYTQLQAKVKDLGGTDADALSQMQTYLQNAQKEADLLGVPLDDNTKALIDQSKQLGIWKDAGKSASDQLIDSMGKLVDKVGQLVDRLNGVTTSINDIPTAKTIDITTRYWSENGGQPGGVDPTTLGLPVYPQAGGGDYMVTKPTLFLAGDNGLERATFTPGGGTSGGDGVSNDDVVDAINELRRDFKALPVHLTSAVTSAGAMRR